MAPQTLQVDASGFSESDPIYCEFSDSDSEEEGGGGGDGGDKVEEMVGKGMTKKKSRLDVLKAALTPSWPSMARYAESGVCACLGVSFSCHFPATVLPLSHSLSLSLPFSLSLSHSLTLSLSLSLISITRQKAWFPRVVVFERESDHATLKNTTEHIRDRQGEECAGGGERGR